MVTATCNNITSPSFEKHSWIEKHQMDLNRLIQMPSHVATIRRWYTQIVHKVVKKQKLPDLNSTDLGDLLSACFLSLFVTFHVLTQRPQGFIYNCIFNRPKNIKKGARGNLVILGKHRGKCSHPSIWRIERDSTPFVRWVFEFQNMEKMTYWIWTSK